MFTVGFFGTHIMVCLVCCFILVISIFVHHTIVIIFKGCSKEIWANQQEGSLQSGAQRTMIDVMLVRNCFGYFEWGCDTM